MDFRLTEQQLSLRKEFESFFEREMKDAPAELLKGGFDSIFLSEETWRFHKQMARKLGERGWLSRAWPRDYGGQEAPLIEQLLFNEVRAYWRAPGVDGWGLGMFAPTVMLFGNEEQKKRLLPPISRGEVHYCQGWSEPDAGSDLAGLRTTAVKQDGHYLVNGQKIWTSGAHRADRMFLLARTDATKARSQGLSMFNLTMDLPGLEVRPIPFMNGDHTYNEVFFNNVKIPEHERIGPENEGWRLTRETMNFERSSIELFAETLCRFEGLLAYVKMTVRNGKRLAEDPLVRQKVAELYADIELGRAFAYRTAWMQEKGGLALAASVASESKLFGSELTRRFASAALEIMGMYGQLKDSRWAPHHGTFAELYQLAAGYTLGGGTSEIQRNLIAWTGLGLPRAR